MPWSETEIRQRLEQYGVLSDKIIELSHKIPTAKQDCWFQLIEYPVRGAAEMNRKHLYGQLARHEKMDWKYSDEAFDVIVSLTDKYNSLADGKWRYMMDYQPRKLPVYEKVPHTKATTSMVEDEEPLFLFNGNEYAGFQGERPVSHGLGYERGAICLPKGTTVTYSLPLTTDEPVLVEMALAPNHPVSGEHIRYAIRIDDEPVQTVDFRTVGRSEEWKENVLRNQAIRTTTHSPAKGRVHTIAVTALDEGVIIDQVKVKAGVKK